MTLLVYAVADGAPQLADTRGLDAKPLLGIERGGLTMVVTEHETPPVALTETNLRRYEHVIERLMERETVLPARFGTTLSEPEASLAVLHERHEELRTCLEGVRGAVELGVQGRWRSRPGRASGPSAEEQSHPGTAYLKLQLDSQRRISQVEERMRPLREMSQRSRAATLPRSDLAFEFAYLVPRARVKRFLELAAELGAQLDDLDLECTGPWPPYSFVNGEVA